MVRAVKGNSFAFCLNALAGKKLIYAPKVIPFKYTMYHI